MADARPPVLICCGPDSAAAASLAAKTAALVTRRRAVVLVAWCPPKLPFSPFLVAWDAVFEPSEEIITALESAARKAATAAHDVLAGAGWEVDCDVVRREKPPWRVALDAADALDASAIVVGRLERPGGLPGALGRQVRALCHRTHRPLLALSPGAAAPDRFAPALFAFDGSPGATRALESAHELLQARPAQVATVWEPVWAEAPVAVAGGAPVTVESALGERDALSEAAAATAGAGAAKLAEAGWSAAAVSIEAKRGPARALVDVAGECGAAVVVTGTRGHSTVVSALIGSVAEGLVRHAGRPVLLVPDP
jgi:nucleotide-binding universal stress UspA family protein